MNGKDEVENDPTDSKPELDIDEGADVMETRKKAIDAQRTGGPARRDEDIISLDPGD